MPVFYRDVMYKEAENHEDMAFLKLYDGHDWKWASSVEKTGYSEVMRTSGAQDRNAGIQSMCMEYQQTCI